MRPSAGAADAHRLRRTRPLVSTLEALGALGFEAVEGSLRDRLSDRGALAAVRPLPHALGLQFPRVCRLKAEPKIVAHLAGLAAGWECTRGRGRSHDGARAPRSLRRTCRLRTRIIASRSRPRNAQRRASCYAPTRQPRPRACGTSLAAARRRYPPTCGSRSTISSGALRLGSLPPPPSSPAASRRVDGLLGRLERRALIKQEQRRADSADAVDALLAHVRQHDGICLGCPEIAPSCCPAQPPNGTACDVRALPAFLGFVGRHRQGVVLQGAPAT